MISDNQDSSVGAINAKQVSAYIAAQLSTIETILLQTSAIAALMTVPEHPLFYELLKQYHFTAHQRQQLKNLLSRWNVLTDQQTLLMDDINLVNAKEVLCWLDSYNNSINFNL